MTDKFEIGDVAIYVRPGSPYFGRQVTVVSNLMLAGGKGRDHVTGGKCERGFKYRIKGIPEEETAKRKMFARPEWLKKKKPPQRECDTLVSWNDCLWKPNTVSA